MASTNILRHVRNYSSAGTLSALAGIVTFPILTRNLTVEEYGILGLIMATLTLFVAVGKLGFQHAVIRYYAQIMHTKSDWTTANMNTTVLVVFGVLAVVTSSIWLISGNLIMPSTLQYEGMGSLFTIASFTVFLRLFASAFLNFLRASERSGKVAKVQVTMRYCYIVFIVLMLFFSGLTPFKVLVCILLAEIIAFSSALYYYRDKISFSLSDFRGSLAKSMLMYGAPLMVLESLGVLLRLTDRYLIQGILGEVELGMYSASYNLTAYLEIIVLATVVQALRPLYMKLWERDGAEPTKDFLANTFHIYLIFGIPFVALFSATAPHLLNFLASPKFAPGTVIIPFVTISFMLDGCVHWLGAGLYVNRNTRVLMLWSVVAAVINLVLNITFIPIFGIVGAAVVTVVSFSIFIAGVANSAFKFLSFDIDWKKPLQIIVISVAIYFLLSNLDFGAEMVNLFVKGFIGLAFCILGIVLVDESVASQLRAMVSKRLGRSS